MRTVAARTLTELLEANPDIKGIFSTNAVGVAGVFIEYHEDPDNAPSDWANMIPLDQIEKLVVELMAFDQLAKGK